MPLTDSARLSTWAVVLGGALALDGLVVGSPRVTIVGVALALCAFLVADQERRADRRKRTRGVSRIAARRLTFVPQPVRVSDGEVYRWENEGGAPRQA